MKVGKNRIMQLPVEIQIMIFEMLRFDDALKLCEALNIPKQLAYQFSKIYNTCVYFRPSKLTKPHLAKVLLKNSSFQSVALANDKVKFAILSQDLELVKRALEDNYDKWFSPLEYFSPLELACEYGQLEVVKMLVNDYGIHLSAKDNIALWMVCNRRGHLDNLDYILQHPDFDPHNCSRVFLSVSNANVVRKLLSDERFDPSFDNNQALINAALNGYLESLKVLLADSRVDPSDQENRAIIDKAIQKHEERF